VWESRKLRAAREGRTIDWVVLNNRLAVAEARNRRRLDERIAALSRRWVSASGRGCATG